MANSREAFLKLIRIAMGWEDDFLLPQDVDWKKFFCLASEQGVEAIALDGLEVLKAKSKEVNTSFSSTKNKTLLLETIGRVKLNEFEWAHHLSALKRLSDILQEKRIPFLLMKGFACGQYYPTPKHRICGDIDIYPGVNFDEANETLKEAGIDVDHYYYRHSVSYINGVMVENHRVLCDLRGPRRQTQAFEEQLKAEAQKSIENGKDVLINGVSIGGAKYPMANFNALFLPWHVSAHFAFERVTLRHLLDWALFLVNDGKNIDVTLFRNAKSKYTYGYSKFADVLTNLSIRYLKMPVEHVPSEIVDDATNFDNHLADKVFDYMFAGQPRERDENVWKFRKNNLKRIWKERWKYKELYNMTTLGFMWRKAMGVVFNVGEHE